MNDPGTSVAVPPGDVAVPSSRAGSPPRRGPIRAVGVLVLALGSGAVGYYLYAHRGQQAARGQEPSGEPKASAGLPVEVAHPRRGGIERTTTQAGSVHAFYHATLFAKVSGYLKEQYVDIGDRVERDQLLAVIDDPEVDKAVDQNKAAVDQAQARVKVAEAKIRGAQAARKAAEAMVKVSETTVVAKLSNEKLQKEQLVRVAGLVFQKAVEKKLEDEQRDRADVSTSEVGMARAGVLSSQAEVLTKAALVEGAEADLVEAQANVEVAQADLAKAKVFQEYTRIKSPYDGVITARNFHPGDFIRSASEGGSLPVLAVAATDRMRVVLPVPDTDVPFVDVGDKAVLQIVALPGTTFRGSVSRFSESEDPESRNMRTEVDLANPDGKLREGMYGRVTLILQAAAPGSVTIPSSGLLGQAGTGEGTVYLVKDGKAHKVEVHVGNDNGVETEILKGLGPDDQVITSYNGSVEEGTPVRPEIKKAAQSSGH